MDDAAADVPKRLFIPRFPLLPLDGYVASSVHSSLRELVYRRNYGIYVISYIYILSFFHSFFRKDANRLVFEWNEWWANRLEIQINRIAHDIASYRIQVAPKPGSTNCARRMALRAHRQLLVFCPGVQLVADQSNI